MGFKFNPFTSNFDLVEGQSPYWRDPVPTRGDLPSGVPDGAAVNVLDEESIFVYDLSSDEWHNTRLSLFQFTAVTNAAGVTIDSLQTSNHNDYRINLHAASSTTPGGVSTVAQNFAGDKTFDNDVTVTGDLTVNGTTTTLNTQTLDVQDANITINNNGNQASADAMDAGLTVEMSDATDVVLGYDSTLTSRMKLGDQGDEREIVTTSHSQIITNKNLKDTSNLITDSSANSFVRETGNQSTFTIPDSVSNDNFVLENFTQTLANKTLNNTNTIITLDTNFTLQDDVDNTKQAQFQLDQITTATSRTYILPDADDTIVVEAAAQTLTNKTINVDLNTVTNIEDGNIKVGAEINAEKIADGSVTNVEFQYINSLTSNAQDQINSKADRDLNNLTAPTAINQNLLPDTGGGRDLGGSGAAWNEIHINDLYSGTGASLVLETSTRRLKDGNGNNSIEFGNIGEVKIYKELDMSTNKIVDVVDPTNDQDAATKAYVDNALPEQNNMIEGGDLSLAENTSVVSIASNHTFGGTTTLPGGIGNATSQGFQPATNISLSNVTWDVNNLGQTGTIVCELRSDNSGVPSSTVLATSTSIDLTTIPIGGIQTMSFDFLSLPALVAGTTYHAVVDMSGTVGTNFNFVRNSTSNDIPTGNISYSSDGGVTWTPNAISGRDWNIEISGPGPTTLDLSLSQDAYLQQEGFDKTRNTIVAQTISLSATNNIAYVTVNKTADVITNLTVNVTDIAVFTPGPNDLIIARQVDNGVQINDKLHLKPGETATIQDGISLTGLIGDLDEVSFDIANNQTTLADITGVLFINTITRSAEIHYSIIIDATSQLYEVGKIMAIQRASDWVISHTTTGDNSQLAFNMTASGQLQYTSANYPGFVSGTLKLRATTTSV